MGVKQVFVAKKGYTVEVLVGEFDHSPSNVVDCYKRVEKNGIYPWIVYMTESLAGSYCRRARGFRNESLQSQVALQHRDMDVNYHFCVKEMNLGGNGGRAHDGAREGTKRIKQLDEVAFAFKASSASVTFNFFFLHRLW